MSRISPFDIIKQQQEENKYRTQVLDLRNVQEHPSNDFPISEEDVRNLADSILKSGGVLQFPLVRLLADGTYQMLAGHRRMRASILLGETIDEKFFRTMCYVLEGISDERAELYLIDTNIQARDLSPKLRAQKVADARQLIETLKERGEMDVPSVKRAVAEHTGVSESTVILQTRIAQKLIPELMDLYDRGKFGMRDAYNYSGLPEYIQRKIGKAYRFIHDEQELQKKISLIIQEGREGSSPTLKEREVSKKANQVKKSLNAIATLKNEGVAVDREVLRSLRDLIDEILRG